VPSITFDLETVTPLFLGGADQSTAELRPPAFRGALRYWFRAIASSIASFEDVKAWEQKIFGSTDTCGAVIVRVQSKKVTSQLALHKQDDLPGLSYLYFSTYESRDKEARGCFAPGLSFKIVLQTRFPSPQNLKCLKLASGAIWALINLGGIGSRSNRGAGNLKLKEVHAQKVDISDIPFKGNTYLLADLLDQVCSDIRAIKEIYKETITVSRTDNLLSSEFDILDPQVANIYLWQPDRSEDIEEWDFILDAFGSKYQTFRKRYKNAVEDDYPQIKEWIRTRGKSSVTTVKRAAFGLPIQFYFTSLDKTNNRASLQANLSINRSSSPLHFKVIPINAHSFAILIIHFKTSLLPSNAKLLLSSGRDRVKSIAAPDQSIISEFISTLNASKVNFL
jgi:CRISPR-associated protein Cmr1